MPVNWLENEADLSPAAMTVRAQVTSPNDNGGLLWDIFFPRENVNSVDLKDISTLDFRPAADRREWNARGRRIPLLTPNTRSMSMVPIESNFKIDEQEIQKLMETAQGNAAQFRQLIGASIPARVDSLAEANYRRLEIDTFQAWSAGTITQRNPEDASKTVTVSFGFDSARYTAEATDWDDAGVNAYDLLLAWIADAEEMVGPIEGMMLRLATLNAILADAPDLPNAVNMTRPQLADRITQDRGRAFEFFVNENSVDIFTDGGIAYTRTKIWPAETIAAIPVGKRIGSNFFAPVSRAMELANQVGEAAGIDVRGNTVYYQASGMGRSLDVECQLNAMPVPDEGLLYVSTVGV